MPRLPLICSSGNRPMPFIIRPAYRTRDRAASDSRLPASNRLRTSRFGSRSNGNFRVDRVCHRLAWTVDGEETTKHFLPPNVLEFSAGALIAEMDYAGIDLALLHTDATLGKDPAFIASCVRAFPDRLRAMAPVDEWRIPTDPDAAIRQAHEAIEVHGLHALKIIPAYAYRFTNSFSFNDPVWRPFWDAVTQLGVPIFFTLGASPDAADPRRGFIQELHQLRRWSERYPGTAASVTHGFNWRDFLDGDRFVLPDEMWAPFAGSNFSMEVCFPVRIGDIFDYPYRECRPVLEAMVEHAGPDRLLWGTDMPFQNRFCTYRQSRHYIENYCQDFLSPEDLAKIMGATAARILGL